MPVSSEDRALVWRDRLRRQARSECSIAEFCRREGVSAPSFYQWRGRLAKKPAPSGSKNKRNSRVSSAFQPVLLTGGAVVSVELASGVRIELPAEQVALVRAVVVELLAADSTRSRADA